MFLNTASMYYLNLIQVDQVRCRRVVPNPFVEMEAVIENLGLREMCRNNAV